MTRELLDIPGLADELRRVLDSSHCPLSAPELFDRLPSRDALLAECANRGHADDAYERAVDLVTETLFQRLEPEVSFDVAQGTGVAVAVGGTLLTSPEGLLVVYRLKAVQAEAR